DRVTRLECRIEIQLDQRADLLRLHVVDIVIPARERVGPQHDPALDLGPESGASGLHVHVHQVLALDPVSVADTVIAGKVGAGFGRGRDVVRRQRVLRMTQRDLDDLRSQLLELRNRVLDGGVNTGLHPLDGVLRRDTYPDALEVFREGGGVIRYWRGD